MTDARHRPSTALATIVVLAGAGGLCWMAATATARFIEQRSLQDVSLALQTGGYAWANVTTNGLQVQLEGTAPSEVQRFRAMTQVASVVDPSRIVDAMQVAQAEAIEAPKFSVELLRNDEGISLIGLVPAETDRLAVVRLLQSETAAPQVTDLLEAAEFPVPEGWAMALDFGLDAAQLARRAKISVAPGLVRVSAITDSPAEKARLETDLRRAKPEEVVLVSEISAPRPVIAPFTLRFVIDDEGARLDACAADDDAARNRILDAAHKAGVAGAAGCTIGLGTPSPQWADAATQAIAAVAEIGQGSVALSDADVSLFAPATVDREKFDDAAGRLEQALPAVFSLQAEREQPVEADAGPAEFLASVSPEQTLYMRGRITDERMREAVDSFASARFKDVESTLRTDDAVPGGWTVRVIAALEAMASLKNGSVTVTPDLVRITGTSGDKHASGKAAATLSQRLGAGAAYELAVRYDERLDPLLGLPTGEECVAGLNTVMSESAIGFEPNKSIIAGNPTETLARLAEIMTDCADFQIELGGHTDSQGSEGFNADLSRARAQAVLTAMQGDGMDTGNLTARGYGESQPVASNETEEGREANRRIEFRLLSEVPVRREPLPEPEVVSGVTEAPSTLSAPAATEDDTGPGEGTEAAASEGQTAAPIGPQLPEVATTTGAQGVSRPAGPQVQTPATVGAAENLSHPLALAPQAGLDADEENARLPVQTPDDTTPRPEPRPEDAANPPQ
ncbi:OmpA family protein [uncultured Paracoccus sp.]|uniref:OmpA family protein n=1 Tax=uncultured Paracoccus sp. TaxID=189685 RepID=UPI002631FC94|nr:OmpA family protein [uncultured Paracoccus sp.]